MSPEQKRCRAMAPIVAGDEGPNYCDLPFGHKGPHSCMPCEVPYDCRGQAGYRRRWEGPWNNATIVS